MGGEGVQKASPTCNGGVLGPWLVCCVLFSLGDGEVIPGDAQDRLLARLRNLHFQWCSGDPMGCRGSNPRLQCKQCKANALPGLY